MSKKGYKKLLKFIFLLFVMCFTIQVDASADICYDTECEEYVKDGAKYKSTFYVASGKTLELYVKANGFFVQGTEKRQPTKIKIEFNTANGISCSVTPLVSSNIYSYDNGVFTLKNKNLSELKEPLAKINCSGPTTNDIIRASDSNSIKIITTSHEEDAKSGAGYDDIVEYNAILGVINQSYLNGLNDSTAINSMTIDGNTVTAGSTYDTKGEKITFKATTNGNLNKNKLEFGQSSEDNQTVTRYPFDKGEKEFKVQYGMNYIEVYETSQKGILIEDIWTKGLDKRFGFEESDFQYSNLNVGIIVKRLDKRSKVNTLATLNIKGVKIDFDPNNREYTATVENKVDKITIDSTLTDPKSSYVDGFGNREIKLEEGENDILVKVRSERGEENIYFIYITREGSNDGTLKEIKVNNKVIKTVEGVFRYTYSVNNDITMVSIRGVPNHSKAKVEVYNVPELKEGENEIKIVVTATNKEETEYILVIDRDTEVSHNANLKTLKVDGYSLGFNQSIYRYTVKIGTESSLNISYATEHENATVNVIGNNNLKKGSIIKIVVTAENKATQTYEIVIDKDEKKVATDIILIVCYIALVVIALLAIGKIIMIILRKKKEKVVDNPKPVDTPKEEKIEDPKQEEIKEETTTDDNNNIESL